MSPYHYEPQNGTGLVPYAYSGSEFDNGVRNAFQNMGRVDVTPLAIPWSGIDVPMVEALPNQANDKAEVNLIVGEGLWRLVYRKATNRWYPIGGAMLELDVKTAESQANTSYSAFTTPMSITVPASGIYDLWFGTLTYQTGGGVSSFISRYNGANDTTFELVSYASTTTGAQMGSWYRITLTGTNRTIEVYWKTSANQAESNYRNMRVLPVALVP